MKPVGCCYRIYKFLSCQGLSDDTGYTEQLFIMELPCNHLDRARGVCKLAGVI